MFNKPQSLLGNNNEFNGTSRFNDPIAMQTDWTPAKRGGASFRTRKLVNVNSNRLEFKASMAAIAFYLVFILIGLVIFFRLPFGGFSFGMNKTMPFLLFSLAFVVIGCCMFYFGTTPIVFDKQNGFFWKGRKAPDNVSDKKAIKHFSELDKIHALQILSEYCRDSKSRSESESSYYSYELNLVLENNTRINVVDHGNQKNSKKMPRRCPHSWGSLFGMRPS
jgi:hypothetical protein